MRHSSNRFHPDLVYFSDQNDFLRTLVRFFSIETMGVAVVHRAIFFLLNAVSGNSLFYKNTSSQTFLNRCIKIQCCRYDRNNLRAHLQFVIFISTNRMEFLIVYFYLGDVIWFEKPR